jgi:hypothetical protein
MIHADNHVVFAVSIKRRLIQERSRVTPLSMWVNDHLVVTKKGEMRWKEPVERVLGYCYMNHVPVGEFEIDIC